MKSVSTKLSLGLLTRAFTCAASISVTTSLCAQQPPPAEKGSVESSGKFVPKTSPNPAASGPVPTREEAEAALLKDLKIDRLSPNQLKIGLVTLDQSTRTVRFRSVVNMTQGNVEYALVTETGKVHEAILTTKASPRDIHLALLLLGLKSATAKPAADSALEIPAAAAVKIRVEWETNGPLSSVPLSSLIGLTSQDPSKPVHRTLPDGKWLYVGSGFDASGFRAQREGSLISLIGDDSALVINPGSDRSNDEIHVPNAALLPARGMPVTVILTCPPTATTPPPPLPTP